MFYLVVAGCMPRMANVLIEKKEKCLILNGETGSRWELLNPCLLRCFTNISKIENKLEGQMLQAELGESVGVLHLHFFVNKPAAVIFLMMSHQYCSSGKKTDFP